MSFELFAGMLRRAGIEPSMDGKDWLDYLETLAFAADINATRKRLGMYGIGIEKYTDGRRLLKDFLSSGGRTSWLVNNDRACALNLGPEFGWGDVLAIWTTHNTKGTARLNVWGVDEWERLEEAVEDKAPISRALARELGVSRTTIERMYRMHGIHP